MAHRVLPAEVKEIINTSLSEPTITSFIDGANLTVTALLGDSTVLSTAQLKQIELWYTAHLIACTRERQVHSRKAGQATDVYEGTTGKGLDATMYGQVCKALDTTGVLAADSGKKVATIYAITSFE